MKKIKKGNALVLTTVILFAVSTIATGVTMYFYYTSVTTRTSNIFIQKHIELETEFNKNYNIILSGEQVVLREGESAKSLEAVVRIEVNATTPTYTFTFNNYKNVIKFVSIDGDVKTCAYSLETSLNNRDYFLQKTIVIHDYNGSNVEYSVANEEVYKVNVNR